MNWQLMVDKLQEHNKKLEGGDTKRLVIFSIIQSIQAVTNIKDHHGANLMDINLIKHKKEWIEEWITKTIPNFDFSVNPSRKEEK